MPNKQADYFKNFQDLDTKEKKELIINQLIIKSYLPAYAQLDLEAWSSIDTQMKLSILKYVFSAPIFHVSGMKLLDEASIVDLDTVTRYSTRFFARFALLPLISEVYNSGKDQIMKDFLHAMASSESFVNSFPCRKDFLQKQSRDHLKRILFGSLIKSDSNEAAIEIAAKCLNVSFIVMMLELRQDLAVEIPDFIQTMRAVFITISGNEEHEHAERMKSLAKIQQWLEDNKSTAMEVELFDEISSQQSLSQEDFSRKRKCISSLKF